MRHGEGFETRTANLNNTDSTIFQKILMPGILRVVLENLCSKLHDGQRAQKNNRLLRGRLIACVIYGHFQSTGAYDTAQGLSDLSSICLQDDDVQDFDAAWDQVSLGTSEMPPEMCSTVCTEMTVIAMNNQDLSRDRVAPSCQKFRNMVRQHVDQTIRTRKVKSTIILFHFKSAD